jgi:outer membrane protein OmpA-like peptidoglycan-associated protein
MKSVLLTALLLAILSFSRGTVAQTIPEKESFDDAEYFFTQEDYEEALASYMKLYKKGFKDNANINYKIGICFLNTNTERIKAISHLEKAATKANAKYTEGFLKEENAPFDVFLFLGNAYRIDNQLDKAINAYNQYINVAPAEKETEKNYAKSQIEACNKAKVAIANPVKTRFTSIGKPVNTASANYNPVITPDENYMVYVTRLKLYDAVMVSKRTNGKWGTPNNITPDIQSDGNQFPVFISYDRNVLLLALQDANNSDIYMSVFDGNSWSKSEPLNREINTKYWESHASMTGDGQTIYFTSNRPQGVGGSDIFYATLNNKGEWGSAKNIGSIINTPLNEETPFISTDGKTLYFSSQGHESIGGYDIYYCEKNDSGLWSAPKSMGYPINTTDDDLFYSPARSGAVAYQAKDMKNKGGIGDLDIARIEMYSKSHPFKYTVSGNLSNVAKNAKFEKIKLRLLNRNTNEKTDSTMVLKDGSFALEYAALPGKYAIQAVFNGYKGDGSEFSIPEDFKPEVYMVDDSLLKFAPDLGTYFANLSPADTMSIAQNATKKTIVADAPATIQGILFPFNGTELGENEEKEVDKLATIMKDNPSLTISIIGYTDSWGKDQYNLLLSENRAKSVKAKIVKKGISTTRIKTAGKGKENPIAINENENGTDNPEGRTFNRRVEFEITKSNNKNIVVNPIMVPENLKTKK